MKKTLSKALSLTLAVLMVIGLLAGCGGSAASNGGGDQTSALPSCASLKVGESPTAPPSWRTARWTVTSPNSRSCIPISPSSTKALPTMPAT